MTNVCYGCADLKRDLLGNRGSGRVSESVFVDSRTGRGFCAECVMALVSWELDGCPDPDEHPYPEWIGADAPAADTATEDEGDYTQARGAIEWTSEKSPEQVIRDMRDES